MTQNWRGDLANVHNHSTHDGFYYSPSKIGMSNFLVHLHMKKISQMRSKYIDSNHNIPPVISVYKPEELNKDGARDKVTTSNLLESGGVSKKH